MPDYTITAKGNIRGPFHERVLKGDVIPFSVVFAPWAEDAGVTLNAATWTVKSGNAGVSGEALTSNSASANITFSQVGTNIIEVSVTDGTLIKKAILNVLVVDPNSISNDYGMCGC